MTTSKVCRRRRLRETLHRTRSIERAAAVGPNFRDEMRAAWRFVLGPIANSAHVNGHRAVKFVIAATRLGENAVRISYNT